jgi:sugar lactone lactonase YvrE
VVRYAPDGSIDRVVTLPVSRPTCPAFGGSDLKTLYITSARDGLSAAELEAEPLAGGVFAIHVDVPGLPENLIKL